MFEFYQRTEPRKRTLLRDGQILNDQHLLLAECRFHDLSQSGARVELGTDAALPKQIRLLDLLYLTARDAEIAWRQGRQLGLRFTSLSVPCVLTQALEQNANKPVAIPFLYSIRDVSQVSDDAREVK